jgi:tetratricopeptide (TPR) repeat protein
MMMAQSRLVVTLPILLAVMPMLVLCQLTNEDRAKVEAANMSLLQAVEAGTAAARKGNWSIAIENFKKASEMDGGDQGVIWAKLGDAYSNAAKGRPTDAATLRQSGSEAYKRAIEKKTADATLYDSYALLLAYQKQIPEALAALEKAVQLDSSSAGKYYYDFGAVLVQTAQFEHACGVFKKATDSDPNYADAHYQYGLCLLSQAKLDKKTGRVMALPGTIEAFQKYLDLKPDGPFAESATNITRSLGGWLQ